MITVSTHITDLQSGDIYLLNAGKGNESTVRVVRNCGDCILLEMLIPEHRFFWIFPKDEEQYVKIIQSKEDIMLMIKSNNNV